MPSHSVRHNEEHPFLVSLNWIGRAEGVQEVFIVVPHAPHVRAFGKDERGGFRLGVLVGHRSLLDLGQ
jgi:hypothetical protein